GLSNHQSGLALDVEDAAGWEPFLERHGWRRLMPQDPVHFDYLGSGTRDIRATAVRAFQQLWNLNNPNRLLAADGTYGPQTQRALNESPIKGFPNGDRIPLDVRKRRLGSRLLRLTRPNLEGEDVRELQIALNKVGFNLEVDGYFGPTTGEAVRKFQTDKGLVVDGIVGSATLEALNMRLQTAA
ncbi:MAG TPA: peptidoglycan-binding domain 1 protein, partial [Cyanobacteria bacterium UBA11371]|nr:peptidoglycan-binding domain 1 protein [Cyanobacteria bacterium UBA11371]